jgi:aminobenzoyl-glutamate utilization protein B
MKTYMVLLALLIFCKEKCWAQKTNSKTKSATIKYIDRKQNDLILWSNQIWNFAEPSLEERKSTALLKEVLKKEGFTIQEDVSGFPTVFIATYGTDKPIIGLFGEYDADPNASNKILPRKEELVKGGLGHGGHHNILGVGSLGAALAIKDCIARGKLKCKVIYYGTTAEGSLGAKTFLARDGYFNDLDLSLYWHPAASTLASTGTWDALIDFDIILSGKRINVIRDLPGPTATLTALEYLLPELQNLRAQMTKGKKLNYVIPQWKGDLSHTPDTIKLNVRIQCTKQEDALAMFDGITKAVCDISDKTKINGRVKVTKAHHQFLPNVTAMQAVQKNMELIGPIIYTSEEQRFAREMQQFLNKPEEGIQDQIKAFSDRSKGEDLYGYTSDIGDASWIAPEIYFIVRTLPPSIPMHQWAGTAFSGHSIAHKGMIQAAKILSLTIIDFLEDKSLRMAIRKDFETNKKSYNYKPLLYSEPKITP